METTRGKLNEQWAKTLIDQLVQQGVDFFCLSPGFRVAPIAIAIAQHPQARSLVHYDERGVAFHALGYAKASGKPACIATTSGTAVGNLLPAVMESFHSQVPLLLLTADRPPELRDTMANQSGDQIKIFGDYIRYYFDLPIPSSDLPERFLATLTAQAHARSCFPEPGPVQLNCPFAEPFFDPASPQDPKKITPTRIAFPQLSISSEATGHAIEELTRAKSGIIIAGQSSDSCAKEISALAEKLEWPLFADITVRKAFAQSPHCIPYYHHAIQVESGLQPEVLVHFGGPFISKKLLQWMKTSGINTVLHVTDSGERCDPEHVVTNRYICTPSSFCKAVTSHLESTSSGWLIRWQDLGHHIGQEIASVLEQTETLTEPHSLLYAMQSATSEGSLFIGNSMPIRDADMFAFSKFQPLVFANRGLSGIDGNIATACGIAQVRPVTAILGDQTLLHDLNSLSLLKKTRFPIKLIVINNKGGGIFSFVSSKEKPDLLDTYFAAEHDSTFAQIAAQYELNYTAVDTLVSFQSALQDSNTKVIEVSSDRQANASFHQLINTQVAKLCASFSSTAS